MCQQYIKKIGKLTIEWKIMQDKEGFIVNADYDGVPLAQKQILNEEKPDYSIGYIPDGWSKYAARGVLSYCKGPRQDIPELFLSLSAPEEENVRLYPPGEEPVDPPSTEFLDNIILNDIKYQDLFPYVYISPWPQISDRDLHTRFVFYNKDSGVDPSLQLLYGNLVREKHNKDRKAMETEAIHFIEGKVPYENQFVSHIREFSTIMKTYFHIYQWLHRQPVIDFKTLNEIVIEMIGSWDRVRHDIRQQEYKNEKERAWESLFALTITAGYRHLLLDDLIKTLVTANLVEITAESLPPGMESPGVKEPGDDHGSKSSDNDEAGTSVPLPPAIGDDDIARLANAANILPGEIFPLPPFSNIPGPGNNSEFVQAYAIGQLVMVRHRLKRYLLGEVNYVENVMKGESKNVTRRRLNQVRQTDINSGEQVNESTDEHQFTGTDFFNEVTKTLCSKKTTTTYNDDNAGARAAASNGTIGGWTVVEDPTGLQDGISKFGKDIVARTVNRMTKTINYNRSVSVMDENEETVVHHYDNTRGSTNMLGIYRWLNKLYKLHTVTTGYRLVLELNIDKPAAGYIENELHFRDIQLCEPVSPGKLGLTSYRDIISDSSKQDHPLYYANLLTRYLAQEIIPPPPQSKTISVVLESVKPYSTRILDLPGGYEAQEAQISIVFQENEGNGSKALVVVGEKNLTYDDKEGKTINLPLTPGLTRSRLPISIMAAVSSSAKPGKKEISGDEESCAQVTTMGYIATVDIRCQRTGEAYEQWEIMTYQQVMRAYDKQKDAYYKQIEPQQEQMVSPDPRVNRDIVFREVKKHCFRLLRELYFKVVGEEQVEFDAVSQQILNEPRYWQFFENMIQWDEMTYQFLADCCNLPGYGNGNNISATGTSLLPASLTPTDKSFNQFLRAATARVLLPIKADLGRVFLYFLSTGTIWAGVNHLVPVIETETDLSIVNELKAITESQLEPEPGNTDHPPIKDEWKIVIPTSMVVLQRGSKFPEFKDEK